MRNRKRILTFFLTAIIPCCALHAFVWPAPYEMLVRNFCMPVRATWSPGLLFAGKDTEVHAVEDAEIIFVYDGQTTRNPLPFAGGNGAVLRGASGMLWVYGGLASRIDKPSNQLQRGEILGSVAAGRAAAAGGFMLQCHDPKSSQTINPLLVLPPNADKAPPVIDSVRLVRTPESVVLRSGALVAAGQWNLQLAAHDPARSGSAFVRLFPYRVAAFHNGKALFQISFDALSTKDSEIAAPLADGRAPVWLEESRELVLGSLTIIPGTHTIEVLVADFAGNMTAREYVLNGR